ncbi:ABC-F family ATP-binding cassette domain-containing protein [Limobrevibacterium gyesilva]|uniref:ATP-binding protein Uup n=1 Tax=Limobrevibacterium gyesilva TaxID=2991712 RepID=A0AA41YP11_9PROT|nr:ATP-binding cassette domain-containing protein [Limobrevibacterium gyesilva]MCW3474023.1 ATP-binding cassette domain-containing protein [Limobrevibacterium gyesilva]
MAPPLLTLQDIRLTLGTAPLLEGAELAVSPGDRLCLVGRNGSGKSTLLRIAAGTLQPDAGVRFLQPGVTVRYLPQEPDLTGFPTTLAYVEAGLGPGDDAHRAAYLLGELGLTGGENPAVLSGGEARRAALARALAPSPDILLLDEPTNHLDLPAIAWLEAELASLRSAMVLISHDRRLLEALSRTIVWLDRGITRRLDRGFAHFEAWRDETLEQEEREQHKLGRKLAMEEDWLRYGVTARRKRNVKRLANLHALRVQRRQQRGNTGGLKLAAAEGELSGKLVVVAKGVGKAFGGRPVIRDLTTRVLRGDRVGIVGPNGAGKTTLLSLLTGQLAADEGEIRLGAGLQMVALDQRRESLDPGATLADTLTGGHGDSVVVNGQSRHVIGYMKDFLFAPEQARTPVGVLSGGERGRLALAVALARPSNLLVLDEPTNDLDLETLELLQELLADYAGTVLLVSHDRDFLDRVCTSVINAEGNGRWIDYAGGYSDMLAQRGPIVNVPAAVPAAPGRPRPAQGSASAPAGPARKLSFKEKHALDTLPAQIDKLQATIAKLRGALADPDLYARDPKIFQRATDALANAETELAQAEERWLELELLREEVESR